MLGGWTGGIQYVKGLNMWIIPVLLLFSKASLKTTLFQDAWLIAISKKEPHMQKERKRELFFSSVVVFVVVCGGGGGGGGGDGDGGGGQVCLG